MSITTCGKTGISHFHARRSMWDRLSAVHLESCRVARHVLGTSRLEVPKVTWTKRWTSGEVWHCDFLQMQAQHNDGFSPCVAKNSSLLDLFNILSRDVYLGGTIGNHVPFPRARLDTVLDHRHCYSCFCPYLQRHRAWYIRQREWRREVLGHTIC